jgi:hypothetical protein
MDSTIVAALIGGGATIAAAIIAVAYSKRHENEPRQSGRSGPIPSESGNPELDSILERLERHHQRATFGSVAGLLRCEPLKLFDACPQRVPRTSWVVSKSTGQPTGQSGSQIHPDLYSNPHVIQSTGELKAWLRSHP